MYQNESLYFTKKNVTGMVNNVEEQPKNGDNVTD